MLRRVLYSEVHGNGIKKTKKNTIRPPRLSTTPHKEFTAQRSTPKVRDKRLAFWKLPKRFFKILLAIQLSLVREDATEHSMAKILSY